MEVAKQPSTKEDTMVTKSMDPLDWLRKKLEDEDADLLREMVREFAQELMGAEVDAICGAPYRARSALRANKRNGFRHRRWDTRAGSIDLAIPKLRKGTFYPSWLLEPRKRAEKALTAVVAECYVKGVSTRRVDALVETLGIDGISKSQVSSMSASLDAGVSAFRSRPLDSGPYPYVWLDAVAIKVRDDGRIVNVAVAVATGVNRDGRREILGVEVFTTEDGAGWLAFLRDLVARGLSGVKCVISDAHQGLRDAIEAVLVGASWQRCRTHFMRNLLCRVPRNAQSLVATLVRSIFAQPNSAEVHAQLDRVIEQLDPRFPDATALLIGARDEITTFTAFPKAHWRQIWSNNPQERLNKEIRRRSNVVGIFPNREAIIRLVGAVLAEQNDEWAVARRYMSADALEKLNAAVEVKQLTEAA
jgi:transposase-like protein